MLLYKLIYYYYIKDIQISIMYHILTGDMHICCTALRTPMRTSGISKLLQLMKFKTSLVRFCVGGNFTRSFEAQVNQQPKTNQKAQTIQHDPGIMVGHKQFLRQMSNMGWHVFNSLFCSFYTSLQASLYFLWPSSQPLGLVQFKMACVPDRLTSFGQGATWRCAWWSNIWGTVGSRLSTILGRCVQLLWTSQGKQQRIVFLLGYFGILYFTPMFCWSFFVCYLSLGFFPLDVSNDTHFWSHSMVRVESLIMQWWGYGLQSQNSQNMKGMGKRVVSTCKVIESTICDLINASRVLNCIIPRTTAVTAAKICRQCQWTHSKSWVAVQ